jgi:hypothetical protein
MFGAYITIAGAVLTIKDSSKSNFGAAYFMLCLRW